MEYILMNADHVSQVAQLEKECFHDPWSENSIASELQNPLSLWLVAVDGQQVAGYVGSQSVMGEADMMNIAVSSKFRRMGIAQELVEGRDIELRNFGVFEIKIRKSRKGRNPRDTRNEVIIPERAVVKFRAGTELKEAVEKLNPADFR